MNGIHGESIGDIVKLVHTSDPYTNLRYGDEGTVTHIDHMGTVFVRWDNGSHLGLIPGQDLWGIIKLNKETPS